MSLKFALARMLEIVGGRRLLATLATEAYRRRSGGKQRFSLDADGHWVNQHPEATVVSPVIHTTGYSAYRDWVIDNWCWQYRPAQGDTIIDVGSGVGEEAIVFSKLVGPAGRVICIEAHPDTFRCLEETVSRSGLTNVTPLCLALSRDDGTASIANVGTHLTSSIVTGSGGSEVPARSLDSLLGELGIDDVALVKMNIEGAEKGAVEGMRASAKAIRNVVISCHDFLADRTGDEALRTKREVRSMLVAAGYKLTERPAHPQPWARDYLYGTREPNVENG